MSEGKHTPGPWRFGADGFSVGKGVVLATQDHGHPLTVCTFEAWGERDMANANLIAAAPELLEALEFVMTAHGEQLDAAFAQAQTAIAKAKGES